jgi:pimeloyl-ACP methyl ester carboxylesterase
MTPILPIHGTWGADFDGAASGLPQWWQAGSPFTAFMRERGLDATYFEPFVWSGDVAGIARLLPWNWFRAPGSRDWEAAARALCYHQEPRKCPVPFAERNYIAHSHGGQVALLAAASGLKIRRLVTVSTPVREDMRRTIELARPNIERWWHLYDPRPLSDRFQVLGELGDGRVGWRRAFVKADRNIAVPGVGHSGLLCEPRCFSQWAQRGLLDFLRGTTRAEVA